jgi:regulator of protease activity HflC (stomatin/prohibitin superfamily)
MDVPAQDVITRDNVSVKVNAVVYFRVVHPESAIIEVLDYRLATFQIAQTTLRSVLGQSDLDELLSQREKLNARLREIIDEQCAEQRCSVVDALTVRLGKATGVMPESLQFAFDALKEPTKAKNAKLTIPFHNYPPYLRSTIITISFCLLQAN